MNPLGIAWIYLETFSHATEDKEKVKSILSKILSFDISFSEKKTYGHFGNEINIIFVELTRNKDIKEFISYFIDKIDKKLVYESVEKRLDEEGIVYIRLSKEKLYYDKFEIDDEGDI